MTTPQSHQPVSAVRARMIEDMTVRGFTEHTRRDYIRCVRALAAFLGRSPDTATAEDLRRFQLHQTQSGMRPPGINSSVSALRFFFTVTLDRPEPNGLAGATIALVAVFLPGLLLLMGVIPFWDAFRAHPNAQALMRGANAAVVGILGAALYDPVFTSAVVGPLPVRPRTDLLRTADGLEDAALGGGDCRRNRRHPDRARLSGRRPGPAGAPDRRDRPGRRRGIWIVGQHLRHRRRSARRAYDLTKTVYLFTAGAIGLVIDSGRIATYVWQGAMLDARLLWGLVVFVPISFIGAKLAERVVDHIPQERFRTVVAVFLGLIALQLLLLLGAMDQGNRRAVPRVRRTRSAAPASMKQLSMRWNNWPRLRRTASSPTIPAYRLSRPAPPAHAALGRLLRHGARDGAGLTATARHTPRSMPWVGVGRPGGPNPAVWRRVGPCGRHARFAQPGR